jgi:serine/threonine-protein kinase RsbW
LRLTFPGTIAGLAEAASRLRDFLDGISLPTARRYQVELVFDEIAGNIIRHGHPATGVVVVVGLDGSNLVLTFDDDGTPFDPCTHEPQPLDTDLANTVPGGLGLGLVRRFATRFEYELTPLRHNRLTVAIPIE